MLTQRQIKEISTKTFNREAEDLLKDAIKEHMELFLFQEQVEKMMNH